MSRKIALNANLRVAQDIEIIINMLETSNVRYVKSHNKLNISYLIFLTLFEKKQ
jgi:hypothetical protein